MVVDVEHSYRFSCSRLVSWFGLFDDVDHMCRSICNQSIYTIVVIDRLFVGCDILGLFDIDRVYIHPVVTDLLVVVVIFLSCSTIVDHMCRTSCIGWLLYV